MKKFPASIPRRMFWSDAIPKSHLCPECGAQLEPESHTYVMAVRSHGDISQYCVGGDYGSFCGTCPVVIVDRDKLQDVLSHALKEMDSTAQFALLGIVDLAAVALGNQHVELGTDANPLPTVLFLKYEAPSPSSTGQGSHKRKRDEHRERSRK